MKKCFFIAAIMSVLLFSSCSVDEDDSGKFQTVSICVPSSKALVSRPMTWTDFEQVPANSEWYAYSKLELISPAGAVVHEIQDFHFGTPYSLVVMSGIYDVKASVVMGSADAERNVYINTYIGNSFVNVEAEKEISPLILNISAVSSLPIDGDLDFDPKEYLPVDVDVLFYCKLPDDAEPEDGYGEVPIGSGVIRQVVHTHDFAFNELKPYFYGKNMVYLDRRYPDPVVLRIENIIGFDVSIMVDDVLVPGSSTITEYSSGAQTIEYGKKNVFIIKCDTGE